MSLTCALKCHSHVKDTFETFETVVSMFWQDITETLPPFQLTSSTSAYLKMSNPPENTKKESVAYVFTCYMLFFEGDILAEKIEFFPIF